MSRIEKFNQRDTTAFLTEHPLFKTETESDVEYVERLVIFLQERFKLLGNTMYVVPHHFEDLFLWARRFYCFTNNPTELINQLIAVKVPRSKSLMDDPNVVSMYFPNAVPYGDFSLEYQHDVFGEASRNRQNHYLASIAIIVAFLTSNVNLTIGTQYWYDPECYISRIFGKGTHCLATSITNYLKDTEDVKNSGDPWILNVMLTCLSQNPQTDVIVNTKEYILESTITLTRKQVLNEVGHLLFSYIKAEEKRRSDEEFDKRWEPYITN